jgi:hypothetical protein
MNPIKVTTWTNLNRKVNGSKAGGWEQPNGGAGGIDLKVQPEQLSWHSFEDLRGPSGRAECAQPVELRTPEIVLSPQPRTRVPQDDRGLNAPGNSVIIGCHHFAPFFDLSRMETDESSGGCVE